MTLVPRSESAMPVSERDAQGGRFTTRVFWLGGPLLAAVIFVAQTWIWQATTTHYHDGAWACAVVDAMPAKEKASGLLVGARGMLLSVALQTTFLLSVLGLGAASVWTLTRVFLHRWRLVVGGSVGIGSVVLLASIAIDAGGVAAAERDCGIVVSEFFFSLEPYRFAVLEAVYPDSVVHLHRSLSRVVWAMLLPVNVLAWVAVVAVPFRGGGSTSGIGLVERFSLLRLLLFWSTAVQTLINLNHLGALGWLAEIASSVGADGPIRDLQAGVTIYFGITNSLLLVLLYGPIGGVLSHHACSLARQQHPGQSSAERDHWRTEHDLVVLKQGPLLRLLVFTAPFLVGAVASALESALLGATP